MKYLSGKLKEKENSFERNFEIKYVPSVINLFIPDADVVVATSWTSSYYVSNLTISKGKKFYLIQGYEKWNSNIKYVDNSYKLNLNRIVVSRYLQNLLKEKFNIDSFLVRNGVDFNKFYNNNNKRINNPIRIIFIDNILEFKNTKCAIDTVIRLKKIFPDLIIRVFGVEQYHALPEFIEFFKNPEQKEIRKLYSESDIFLFPSKYEGFGLPPAEAMACKCAVVGNAVAALPEYSINGETAILVNPDDENGLFEATKMLIENPDLLKKISLGGYQHVKKILDFNRAVNEFEKLLIDTKQNY